MDFCSEAILSSKKTVEKFQELRKNDKFCDISLFSGNSLVKAHRVVLAASCPYFEAMFNVGLKESQQVFINLPSVSPDVLPLLVDFIYTGRTRISESTAQQLMVAAHMLQIQDLVKGCIKYLKSHLDPSNALSIFRFAETLCCSDLADRALVYIGKHWASITQTEDFLDLPLPDFAKILSSNEFIVNHESDIEWYCQICNIVLDCCKKLRYLIWLRTERDIRSGIRAGSLSEMEVVVSVVRWLEHDPALRVPDWDKLIPLLHLGTLSTNILDNVWKDLGDMKLKNILKIFNMGMVSQADDRPRGCSTFYIVGGFKGSLTAATVFKFDTHKKAWEVVAPMATPRTNLSVAVLMGRLYAVGGADGAALASGEVYNPTNMARPTKRAAHRSHPYCKPLRSSIDHHIRLRQLLDHNDLAVGDSNIRIAYKRFGRILLICF
ncbi:Kelch-like protein 17 [Eumeta japonica]|uniref:Kelch-like protein 17 n=1 Tax=Eumeta variegata TaxID=151549 RepID=A0A4C1UBA4_EUMVA|nr:Kelch-like protein 17 [Eumeta japonica]